MKLLHVQKRLLKGKSLEKFSIKQTKHPELPLTIYNYDQINSPKDDTITRECRGLVLDDKVNVVAKSFLRFYNYAENRRDTNLFDWSNFLCEEKLDGSIILVYYYQGWRINTRNSFGDGEINGRSWKSLVLEALGVNSLEDIANNLNPDFTYVCELCSPWNKVIRQYNRAELYLLTVFNNKTLEEFSNRETARLAIYGMLTPPVYLFSSIDEVQQYLEKKSRSDPTFEGFVLRDHNNVRLKVKSPSYLGLHKIKNNNNIFLPKYLLPFVLKNDEEILVYFPEIKEEYHQLKKIINVLWSELMILWSQTCEIKSQKEFALQIKDHPLSCVLFNVRKLYGSDASVEELREEFIKHEEVILKSL